MSYFKKIKNLPIVDLQSELNRLIEEKTVSWSSDNQICLNTTKDNLDDFFLGCGSLSHDWNNAKKVIDQYGNLSLEVPKYKVPYKEQDFSILCNQFKNTVFEELYQQLSKKYVLGRVRLMKSKPKTCLSWHTDSSPRLHYPIVTQEGCFMIIDKEVMHLPQNTWWWTNTTVYHTAFNASKKDRIHLVVVVLTEI